MKRKKIVSMLLASAMAANPCSQDVEQEERVPLREILTER